MYHRPKGESAKNLALMRRIDELFLSYPFYGSRCGGKASVWVGRGRAEGTDRAYGR